VVAYKSLKTDKEKVQLGNPKSGRGCLRELFITKLKSQFKWGFVKGIATRPGRLQEWSQGLYLKSNYLPWINQTIKKQTRFRKIICMENSADLRRVKTGTAIACSETRSQL